MSPQEMLWSIPSQLGATWWLLCSAFATPAAIGMFLYLVMNQPFSGLLLARIVILASLVCFALIPLNSGWLPWGALLASIGGAYATFLLVTDWCNTPNKWTIISAWFRRHLGSHPLQ